MSEDLYFAGWVIDGTGNPAGRNMLMRVENGMITSLEGARQAELRAAGLEYADLSDCTIMPGLVDCHVHLTMSGKADPGLREEQLEYGLEKNVPLIASRIQKGLSRGIMALRDGGDAAGHSLKYIRGNLFLKSSLVRIKCAGKGWRASGRYGRFVGGPPESGLSLMESIKAQSEGTDHVKIINSGLNSLKIFGKQTRPQFDPEELKAATDVAHSRGLKVMVHANGEDPVRNSVEAGCDSIEHGFFMGGENLRRIADRQVFWVPTAFTMKAPWMHLQLGSVEAGIASKNLELQLEQIALARKIGVPVAAGTDAGSLGVRHGTALAQEMKLIMQAGFTAEEAIRCAAFNGARLLGLDHELGRIARGMPANFIVVDGSPSGLPESLEDVEAVYVRGKAVMSTE